MFVKCTETDIRHFVGFCTFFLLNLHNINDAKSKMVYNVFICVKYWLLRYGGKCYIIMT